MLVDTFVVDSPNVRYDDEHITAAYECATLPTLPSRVAAAARLRRCTLRRSGAPYHAASLSHATRNPHRSPRLSNTSATDATLA
jgi:hypothetical protein